MFISAALQKWYHLNKRDLPWRKTGSPYHIWLSEVILQQTRINQGIGYYYRFLDAFPDVHSMAAASIDYILNIWKGLGYYNRAVHMHLTAQEIVQKWNGIFPDDYDRLLELKGIGPYSAAAIASIAFNHPYAVVDGNVIRVLSRLNALDIPMDDVAGRKIVQNQATSLLDTKNPGIHNQAMMELGALICLPRNPSCSECPLSAWCKAYIQNKVQFFPVKSSRTRIRERHLNYFFIESEGQTVIKKRTGKDIWKYLFEFPLIETECMTDLNHLKKTGSFKELFGKGAYRISEYPVCYKHKLTHQLLLCSFYRLVADPQEFTSKGYIPVAIKSLNNYAFPVLISRYLNHLSKDLTI